jgi:centrosomal CEP192-like protein
MAILVAAGAASAAQAARPPVTASPEPLHLRSFEPGHAVAGTVRLTNVSRKTYRIEFVPEPPESAFSVSDSSCSGGLAYRESCQITVRFKPKHWGATTGKLVYMLNGDPLHAYAVRLVGTAHQRDGVTAPRTAPSRR